MPLSIEKCDPVFSISDSKCFPPKEIDRELLENWADLLKTLEVLRLPKTKEFELFPQGDGAVEGNSGLIVYGRPRHVVPLMVQSGVVCPMQAMLVLSRQWLSCKPDPENGSSKLYATAGVLFDSCGNSYFRRFSPSRLVSMAVNLHHDNQLQSLIHDVPRLRPQIASEAIDNPLAMRQLLLRCENVKHPKTAVVVAEGEPLPACVAALLETVVYGEGDDGGLRAALFDRLQLQPDCQMWLRLNGQDAIGCEAKDVCNIVQSRFHPSMRTALAVERVCAFRPENAPTEEEESEWTRGQTFTVRCSVVWWRDRPTTVAMLAVVHRTNQCLPQSLDEGGADAPLPVSLDCALKRWGCDMSQRSELCKRTRAEAERVFEMVHREYDDLMLLGVELVLAGERRAVDLVVSNLDSRGFMYDIALWKTLESLAVPVPEPVEPSADRLLGFQPLLSACLHQAQCGLLHGRHVLVIGGCDFGHKGIWTRARNEFGLKVTLVDECVKSQWVGDLWDHIQFDLTDHSRDEDHACRIVAIVQERQLSVDRCISLWEDCLPLAARVAELLHLPSNSYTAMHRAVAKTETMEVVLANPKMDPLPAVRRFGSRSIRIRAVEDVDVAVKQIEFPAVLKLEHGCGAVGVKQVHSTKECHNYFTKVTSELRHEADLPGVGLGHGNMMSLMDWLGGSEHDVDVVMLNGQLVAAFCQDNGPTRLPFFTQTAAACPSFLHPDEQSQLIACAYQSCRAIGLRSGVFNVELKLTPSGPKLIEINARVGGFLGRRWIRECYDCDLLLASFLTAFGLRPSIPHLPRPLRYCVGVYLVPSRHGAALRDPEVKRRLEEMESDEFYYEQLFPVIEDVPYEEVNALLAASDACSHAAAVGKLVTLVQEIGLFRCDENSCAYYLNSFQ